MTFSTKNFIKELIHKTKYVKSYFMAELDGKSKLIVLLDILITGIILKLIIDLWTHPILNFISFGLLSAISLYYLRTVTDIIKKEQ